MKPVPFKFKQFVIHQDKCAMKVGTDAVLLGALADGSKAASILDIGTGTGIISIMLAQKTTAEIDAIDIDDFAYEQAKENVRLSPWSSKINVYHISLQEYALSCRKKYDLIVSNPPYFVDASKAPAKARNKARHSEDSLPFDELAKGVEKLLRRGGHFCVILPYKESGLLRNKTQSLSLYCNTIIRICTKKGKIPKRVIMCFEHTLKPIELKDLIIQKEDNSYTKEYIELTKEYYVNY